MEAGMPSMLWQPGRFYSRMALAKACMAACVRMRSSGGSRRRRGSEQKGCSLAGFSVGEESEECRRVMAPMCFNFQPEDNKGGTFVPCSSSRPLEVCLCIALKGFKVFHLVHM